MAPSSLRNHGEIRWGHAALTLVIQQSEAGVPEIVRLDGGVGRDEGGEGDAAEGSGRGGARRPLVEISLAGEGRTQSSVRSIETAIGSRLRYVDHRERSDGKWMELCVYSQDPVTGLDVETQFRSVEGLAALTTMTRVTSRADAPLRLHSVSSFVAGALAASTTDVDDVDLYWAKNDWLAESRWQRRDIREIDLPDLGLGFLPASGGGRFPRGRFTVSNTGTWSASTALPVGCLVDRRTGRAWMWQIEHNGSWQWEVGEQLEGLYLALWGPTDVDHQWQHVLEPGESFSTVPGDVAVSDAGGLEGAASAMTGHRRAITGSHSSLETPPVIYNDFMNTLNGDPTTEKVLPLIDGAAAVGAEYFCIDAGWYGELGERWWDAVGAWEESPSRFPGGLREVIDKIRGAGMVPGLWLEPEVVGVRSPVAGKLPDEAFFQRGGHRQIEVSRYHLDFRHPAVVAYLDSTVDRLVDEYGIGYFKLDYNVSADPGTDHDADSAGDGLLAHNRAHLAWLDCVLRRHPNLVIENCASGGRRVDYAMLSRLHLQSTSDQRSLVTYPPIAASAPMAMLPEQAANWAYPQPEMSTEEIAFTLITSLAGHLYLSGHLNRLDDGQLHLVSSAVALFKRIRVDIARAVPIWPLGLPGWSDAWVALGLRVPTTGVTYLALWRRPAAQPECVLPLPHLKDAAVHVECLFPRQLPRWDLSWDPQLGALTAASEIEPPTARLIKLRPEQQQG